MIPLQITAHLQVGVISDAYLPIDGLFYYIVHRDALNDRDVTRPGRSRFDGHPPSHQAIAMAMPLAKHHRDQQDWFFAASFAQWDDPVATGTDHWTKRFDQRHSDLIDFGSRRGRIITEQAQYKSYHMPVFYRHALRVRWYVVGDFDRITYLLRFARNLGKKTAQGYGAVLRWDVQPWHADWSIYDDDGRLMRAIPDDSGTTYGIRPSYWLHENQTRCKLP